MNPQQDFQFTSSVVHESHRGGSRQMIARRCVERCWYSSSQRFAYLAVLTRMILIRMRVCALVCLYSSACSENSRTLHKWVAFSVKTTSDQTGNQKWNLNHAGGQVYSWLSNGHLIWGWEVSQNHIDHHTISNNSCFISSSSIKSENTRGTLISVKRQLSENHRNAFPAWKQSTRNYSTSFQRLANRSPNCLNIVNFTDRQPLLLSPNSSCCQRSNHPLLAYTTAVIK
jgi:hypothetical protein